MNDSRFFLVRVKESSLKKEGFSLRIDSVITWIRKRYSLDSYLVSATVGYNQRDFEFNRVTVRIKFKGNIDSNESVNYKDELKRREAGIRINYLDGLKNEY